MVDYLLFDEYHAEALVLSGEEGDYSAFPLLLDGNIKGMERSGVRQLAFGADTITKS